MNKIDIFNNSAIILSRKVPSTIIGYQLIIGLIFLLFIVFSIFFSFNKYKTYTGQVIETKGEYYVSSYIQVDDFRDFNISTLIIDKQQYVYEIINISDKYNMNNQYYYEVLFKINLKKEYLLKNNIVTLNFKFPKTTIFNIIKEKIKKGLM